MFNLEQAISDWKRQMVACGFNSVDVLQELESHLRDHVAGLVASGVKEESAFELACRRLGSPRALSEEFVKCDKPKAAPQPTFLRSFYLICAIVAILADVWTFISFELSPGERAGAALCAAVLALYLFGLLFWSWRTRPAVRGYFLKLMKALGIVAPLWTLFALVTALRIIHVEIGIVPEMIMWSLCAAYGLTALAWIMNQDGGGESGHSGGFLQLNPAPKPFPPKRSCPWNRDIPVPRLTAFTPAAQLALEIAREEALSLGHDFVGTEHVLLGLLKAAGDAMVQMLQRSRVTSDAIRAEVRRLVSGFPSRPVPTALPLTPRARRALQIASREADAIEHSQIGTEHILLGLLLEGSGVAAMTLRNLGVQLDRSFIKA